MHLNDVVFKFGIKADSVLSHGSGLINNTWLVNSGSEKFILQKINQSVFKLPQHIAHNIRLVTDHLRKFYPDQLFITPITTASGNDLVKEGEDWFRMFEFIDSSHTIVVVENEHQASEAAKQFGRFTARLSDLDASLLKITLPHFHDLSLRYWQFEDAVKQGNPQRVSESGSLIKILLEHSLIVDEYESMITDPDVKFRVTHHDTKISNVLFDEAGNGMAVIDLDTVMPGYFFSDVGDMMRTYLSPVSEEEKNFDKIIVRPGIYQAIVDGYTSEMGEQLSEREKNSFSFSGKFMIYMQALRFLTDHLNDDVYYGAKYEGHNFVRACNQARLLEKYIEAHFTN